MKVKFDAGINGSVYVVKRKLSFQCNGNLIEILIEFIGHLYYNTKHYASSTIWTPESSVARELL